MAARPDRTDVLRAFDGPVVVVVGDEDTVTPVAAAEHMVARPRTHARLVGGPARRPPDGDRGPAPPVASRPLSELLA